MAISISEDTNILKNLVEESATPTAFYESNSLRIVIINRVMREFLQVGEDVIGHCFQDVFADHSIGYLQDTLQSILQGLETEVRVLVPAKEASRFSVLSAVNDATGKVCAISHTIEIDQTELHDDLHVLNALVENSEDYMGISDTNLRMVYLNRSGRKLIGLDPCEDIRRYCVKDFYRPGAFDTVVSEISRELKLRGKWSGRVYLQHFKTKEEIPFQADFIQIYDNAGQAIARGATLRDLRAEIAASEALRLSEMRFRNLVQEAPVAISVLRGEDLIIEVANDQTLKLWGKERSIVGMPLLKAIPEIKDQEFAELLHQVLNTGEPVFGDEQPAHLIRNGRPEICYFNFVYAPIHEYDGSISGVIAVGNEVTSQVISKKKVEESEKRFRSIVLEAPMAKALYVGPDMVIELANDSMIKLWGKDESVVGEKLRDALPELEGQPFFDLLHQVYTTGVPYHSERQSADLVVDGKLQTFWFNFTYKPLRDENGKVYAILNSAVDISSQVYLQKQKDDFLGVASHELKTPVTSIKAYAQVLETMLREAGDSEKADMVAKLDSQVNRLTNLIKNLLDVTKINSGRIEFSRSYFDFNAMIREAIEEVQRTTSKHFIREELKPVGDVYADRERLSQVVTNFLTNAIKYSPDADKIKVCTEKRFNEVQLCVEDYGIGISKQKQSKVFEQFYRVGGEMQTTFPGLGLGLYISSEIIKREGGKIWLESEEGKGSRFCFTIPLDVENKL